MSTTPLTSIRTSAHGGIEIVNQLALPHKVEWVRILSPGDAHDAIKSMMIRGAPAIASLAALSVGRVLTHAIEASPEPATLASPDDLKLYIFPTLDYLSNARPTAVNLGAAMRRLKTRFDTSASSGKDARAIATDLIQESTQVYAEDVGRNKEMSKWGAEYLANLYGANERLNVLTVCNTGSLATSGYGTALGLITHLHETGKLERAYYTQTAPYHQGSRLTALELTTLHIPSTMICDTMVGSLFQHHKIHAVVVGADRVAMNGDTANKIGTYNAAVLAARHDIPFLVVAPISTLDLDIVDGTKIPIEHRPPEEACLVRGAIHPRRLDAGGSPELVQVMITPSDLDGVYNPSFDVTPAELITAVVTEKGVAVRKPGSKDIDLGGVV